MNTRDRGRKFVAQVCAAWRCPAAEGATNPWRRHFQPKLGVPCALPARVDGLCIVGGVSGREVVVCLLCRPRTRRILCVRRAGGEGGRAGGRATEQFDVAQLRAGGDDRAHDVGGGHATRESRRGPLRARRAKAAMSGAAISHLWAVIGVTSHLSELDPGRAWGHAGPVCSSSAN